MNITAVQLAILGFMIWRLSSLFANEAGPFDIFLRFRLHIGVMITETGNYAETPFAQMIICVWCSSIWFAIAIALSFYLLPGATIAIGTIFAFSTIAVLIDETLNKFME
jgi:hypothetical protein